MMPGLPAYNRKNVMIRVILSVMGLNQVVIVVDPGVAEIQIKKIITVTQD